MDTKVIEFLINAKKDTYAGHGAETGSSRPSSHDLHYSEGDLMYIDTYLGSHQFAGEEALWGKDIPIWAMNYVGRVVADGFDGDFLKEALSLVPIDMPYRGPAAHSNGEFLYRCSVHGDFDWFNGYEEIIKKGDKVYECFFHGGSIKG